MIEWLTQEYADCGRPPPDWLGPRERERLAALKTDKRRADWLVGRWTAKRLLQSALARRHGACLPLAALEIQAARDGAPFATYALNGGASRSQPLSLSHSGRRALCALSLTPCPIGADLERVEPRSPLFVADYFTPAEIALVEQAPPETRDLQATAIWSAKEAALKALRLGLTVDTRAVTCLVAPAGRGPSRWTPFSIRTDAGRLPAPAPPLTGWWRTLGDFVLALAAAPGRGARPRPAPARLG